MQASDFLGSPILVQGGRGARGAGGELPLSPLLRGHHPLHPQHLQPPCTEAPLCPELDLHLLAPPNYTQTIECIRITWRTWQNSTVKLKPVPEPLIQQVGGQAQHPHLTNVLVKLSLLSEPAFEKHGSRPAGSQPQLTPPEVHLKVAMPAVSDTHTHTHTHIHTHTPARKSELGG